MLGPGVDPAFLAAIAPIGLDSVEVRPAPRALQSVWGRSTGAMTLGRRIMVDPSTLGRGGEDLATLLRHELVHVRQWHEQGAVGFLIRYLRQYLVGRLGGARHRDAYRAIAAEVEARRLSSL